MTINKNLASEVKGIIAPDDALLRHFYQTGKTENTVNYKGEPLLDTVIEKAENGSSLHLAVRQHAMSKGLPLYAKNKGERPVLSSGWPHCRSHFWGKEYVNVDSRSFKPSRKGYFPFPTDEEIAVIDFMVFTERPYIASSQIENKEHLLAEGGRIRKNKLVHREKVCRFITMEERREGNKPREYFECYTILDLYKLKRTKGLVPG